jgi:uncharacterized protein (DUF697 family)
MFKLVAFLFLMLPQGGYSDTPTAVLRNGHTFATQEACMNYFDTDIGALDKQKLDAMIAADDEHKYKAEFKCLPMEEKP